jgi:hypothetical protein
LTSSPGRSRRIPTPLTYGRRAELRFTVRRPASAEVSPCCHRPSGGDVAYSVVRPDVAGFALKYRLVLTVFGSAVPARRALLRPTGGRGLLGLTVSPLSETRSEQDPTPLADSPVQPTFLSNRHMAPGPPLLMLLHGRVPYTPCMPTMVGANGRRFSAKNQPTSRHHGNLTATTDKSPKGGMALPPPAKARGFPAARIR